MHRRPITLLLVGLTLTLTACGGGDYGGAGGATGGPLGQASSAASSAAGQAGKALDKAQACTKVISAVSRIDLRADADKQSAQRQIDELASTIAGLEAPDVKQAAQPLESSLRDYVSRLGGSPAPSTALVQQAARPLGDVCKVPVEQIVRLRS